MENTTKRGRPRINPFAEVTSALEAEELAQQEAAAEPEAVEAEVQEPADEARADMRPAMREEDPASGLPAVRPKSATIWAAWMRGLTISILISP